jgi:hypothetical protein
MDPPRAALSRSHGGRESQEEGRVREGRKEEKGGGVACRRVLLTADVARVENATTQLDLCRSSMDPPRGARCSMDPPRETQSSMDPPWDRPPRRGAAPALNLQEATEGAEGRSGGGGEVKERKEGRGA